MNFPAGIATDVQGLDCYTDHLIELEYLINKSLLLGQVIVLGDFNAHLGTLGGIRGKGAANVQGVLISEVMARCNLSAVSLSSLATGSDYTYFSGDVRTTVDYVFADAGTISLMSGCVIAEIEDLNTSDHVPITVNLIYDSISFVSKSEPVWPRIDWSLAARNGSLLNYQEAVRQCLSSLPDNCYQQVDDINAEIIQVTGELLIAAYNTLPTVRLPSSRRRNSLSPVCTEQDCS